MEYAYIRVSAKDQNIARQLNTFMNLKIPKKNIYIDYSSGKDFERPKYQELIKKLKKDDVLFLKELDRLGRNYDEIIENWKMITKVLEVDIVVLDMPLLDTRLKTDLLKQLIVDLILQILSYVAETERTRNKIRQREGIDLALQRGVKFGRPLKATKEEFLECYNSYKKELISIETACEELNVSMATFRRYTKRYIDK